MLDVRGTCFTPVSRLVLEIGAYTVLPSDLAPSAENCTVTVELVRRGAAAPFDPEADRGASVTLVQSSRAAFVSTP